MTCCDDLAWVRGRMMRAGFAVAAFGEMVAVALMWSSGAPLVRSRICPERVPWRCWDCCVAIFVRVSCQTEWVSLSKFSLQDALAVFLSFPLSISCFLSRFLPFLSSLPFSPSFPPFCRTPFPSIRPNFQPSIHSPVYLSIFFPSFL